MVRQWQNIIYDKHYSETILDRGPDFVKLAESYGAKGIRVEKEEDIAKAFKKAAKETKVPTLIEFIIDREENVMPMVPPGKPLDKVLRTGNEPATVDEYIALREEKEQKYLIAVRSTIREALPDAKEIISWGMPTYWKGRNIIHFAAQKKHIGLYPGDKAVEAFAESLKEYDVSKGTIRIPYSDDIPLNLIAEIAEWCEKHN